MTKPMNTAAYERATGRPWGDWVTFLDGLGAREREHPDIVPLVQKALQHLELKNHGWWAQGITIAYEQHIGRRIPGQKSDGSFASSASKTFTGSMDDALATWIALVDGRTTFLDVHMAGESSTSSTAKWRYWRCGLSDGSRVSITFTASNPGKCRVTADHTQFVTPEEAADFKIFWKSLLSDI